MVRSGDVEKEIHVPRQMIKNSEFKQNLECLVIVVAALKKEDILL